MEESLDEFYLIARTNLLQMNDVEQRVQRIHTTKRLQEEWFDGTNGFGVSNSTGEHTSAESMLWRAQSLVYLYELTNNKTYLYWARFQAYWFLGCNPTGKALVVGLSSPEQEFPLVSHSLGKIPGQVVAGPQINSDGEISTDTSTATRTPSIVASAQFLWIFCELMNVTRYDRTLVTSGDLDGDILL
jgi:hypothetical protein